MIPRQLAITVAVMLAAALGMTFYALRMRRADRNEAAAASTQPVAPPVFGPTEQVTLYAAYDDTGTLRPLITRIPLPSGRQERAEELLRALLDVYLGKLSPHPLGAGAEVRNVYLVEPGLAVIDVNAAFSDSHRSGVLVEELTLASLVQTLAANVPGITRVKLLVDGKQRETLAGHVDLTEFYDVSAVSQMVAGLEAPR